MEEMLPPSCFNIYNCTSLVLFIGSSFTVHFCLNVPQLHLLCLLSVRLALGGWCQLFSQHHLRWSKPISSSTVFSLEYWMCIFFGDLNSKMFWIHLRLNLPSNKCRITLPFPHPSLPITSALIHGITTHSSVIQAKQLEPLFHLLQCICLDQRRRSLALWAQGACFGRWCQIQLSWNLDKKGERVPGLFSRMENLCGLEAYQFLAEKIHLGWGSVWQLGWDRCPGWGCPWEQSLQKTEKQEAPPWPGQVWLGRVLQRRLAGVRTPAFGPGGTRDTAGCTAVGFPASYPSLWRSCSARGCVHPGLWTICMSHVLLQSPGIQPFQR